MAFYGHRVKEFMRRELATCRPTTPTDILMGRMLTLDIGMLLVVDDDGYALGLISRNDLMHMHRGIGQPQIGAGVAGDIMKPPLTTCFPDTLLRDAVTDMYCRRIDHLLVVKPGEGQLYPMGMLWMSDIIRQLVHKRPAQNAVA